MTLLDLITEASAEVKQRLDAQQAQIEDLQARLCEAAEETAISTRIDSLDTTLNQRLDTQGKTMYEFRCRLDVLENAAAKVSEWQRESDERQKGASDRLDTLEAQNRESLEREERQVTEQNKFWTAILTRLERVEKPAPATACDCAARNVVHEKTCAVFADDLHNPKSKPAIPSAVDLALLVREYRDNVGLDGVDGMHLIQTAERVLKQPPQPELVEPMVPARLVRDYFASESWTNVVNNQRALFAACEIAEREAHK